MTILDKHPAPWSWDKGEHAIMNTPSIVDALGGYVVSAQDGISVGDQGDNRDDEAALKRLILAAPELLAALKAMVTNEALAAGTEHAVSIDGQAAEALIARIEEVNDAP